MAKPTKSEISAKAIEGAPKALADAYRGASLITSSALQTILKVGKEGDVADLAYLLDKPLSTDEIELMLSNQAILLNAMGHRQAKLSFDCMELGARPESSERFMKNSYKALELSRKCLTALNEIRNPKRSATFVKNQLNQVNLGNTNGSKTMDRITEGTTESFNPTVATVETLDRCEDIRRQN
jgi:hypothetical protein